MAKTDESTLISTQSKVLCLLSCLALSFQQPTKTLPQHAEIGLALAHSIEACDI